MKNTILSLFVLFAANTINGQAFWKETLNMPFNKQGRGNTCIAIDPFNDNIFVGCLEEGVFRSNNSGDSWEQVLSVKTSISKLLIKDHYIFAGAPGAIHRSSDRGETWEEIKLPGKYLVSDIILLKSGELVLSSSEVIEKAASVTEYFGDGVFISSDNGSTWTACNNGFPDNLAITQLASDSKDVIYAGYSNYAGQGAGIYYSRDKGKSWNLLNEVVFRSADEKVEIKSFYSILMLEVDRDDSVYFSYEGSGGNFGMSGTLKNTLNAALDHYLWEKVVVKPGNAPWDFSPASSMYFASNGIHRYSSVNTPLSKKVGGTFFYDPSVLKWKRVVDGIEPVTVGNEYGYRTFEYAQASNGRIYAIQYADNKVYFSDTSLYTPTAIKPINTDLFPVKVYPNPTSDYLYIVPSDDAAGNLKYQVINLQGQLVLSGLASSEPINVASLPAGFYVVNLRTAQGGSHSQKISITR